MWGSAEPQLMAAWALAGLGAWHMGGGWGRVSAWGTQRSGLYGGRVVAWLEWGNETSVSGAHLGHVQRELGNADDAAWPAKLEVSVDAPEEAAGGVEDVRVMAICGCLHRQQPPLL